jgi:hypothetical protein
LSHRFQLLFPAAHDSVIPLANRKSRAGLNPDTEILEITALSRQHCDSDFKRYVSLRRSPARIARENNAFSQARRGLTVAPAA